ncbi:MAG: anti-sigma factor [Planctomycetota bacterium]
MTASGREPDPARDDALPHDASPTAETTAALDALFAEVEGARMPAEVADRVGRAMQLELAGAAPRGNSGGWPGRKAVVAFIAGGVLLAAAAAAFFAISAALDNTTDQDRFVRRHADATEFTLRQPGGPNGGFTCGSVIWSTEAGQGVVFLPTLPVNARKSGRYTLWARAPDGVHRLHTFDLREPETEMIAVPPRPDDPAALDGVDAFFVTLAPQFSPFREADVVAQSVDP